jgi:hypothetical protein
MDEMKGQLTIETLVSAERYENWDRVVDCEHLGAHEVETGRNESEGVGRCCNSRRMMIREQRDKINRSRDGGETEHR